jgi:hypothetical protein
MGGICPKREEKRITSPDSFSASKPDRKYGVPPAKIHSMKTIPSETDHLVRHSQVRLVLAFLDSCEVDSLSNTL